jgi:hypothetical protein
LDFISLCYIPCPPAFKFLSPYPLAKSLKGVNRWYLHWLVAVDLAWDFPKRRFWTVWLGHLRETIAKTERHQDLKTYHQKIFLIIHWNPECSLFNKICISGCSGVAFCATGLKNGMWNKGASITKRRLRRLGCWIPWQLPG